MYTCVCVCVGVYVLLGNTRLIVTNASTMLPYKEVLSTEEEVAHYSTHHYHQYYITTKLLLLEQCNNDTYNW